MELAYRCYGEIIGEVYNEQREDSQASNATHSNKSNSEIF